MLLMVVWSDNTISWDGQQVPSPSATFIQQTWDDHSLGFVRFILKALFKAPDQRKYLLQIYYKLVQLKLNGKHNKSVL